MVTFLWEAWTLLVRKWFIWHLAALMSSFPWTLDLLIYCGLDSSSWTSKKTQPKLYISKTGLMISVCAGVWTHMCMYIHTHMYTHIHTHTHLPWFLVSGNISSTQLYNSDLILDTSLPYSLLDISWNHPSNKQFAVESLPLSVFGGNSN